MKILISGGIKTQNIVNGINNKFSSGGVDFVVVPFIEDIDDIYQRGEYFDKAIIIEQSWNHDYEDENEMAIRNRIYQFANSSLNRGVDNVGFVFLTQDSDMAAAVYEEIMPIRQCSVVLVKQPRYSVSFFIDLIKLEIDKFPEEIVYKPEVKEEVEVKPKKEEPVRTPEYNPQYDTDFETELFGHGDLNANGLPIDSGEDIGDTGSKQPQEEEPDESFRGFEDIPDIDDGYGQGGDEIPQGAPGQSTGFEIGGDFETENGGAFDYPEEQPAVEEEDSPYQEEQLPMSHPMNYDNGDENVQEFHSGEIPDYSQGGRLSRIDVDKHPDDSEPEYQEPAYEEPSYEEPPYQEPAYQEPEQGYTPDDSMYDQGGAGYDPSLDDYTPNGSMYQSQQSDADSMYDEEPNYTAPVQPTVQRPNLTNAQIRATLDAFANRGNSILVTGCGGCGTSTVAFNLANIINNLGYTVLLVDLDTENKAQSYISKDNYECIEPDSAALMAAINSTSGINAHISIVRQKFHLLTMGMASDSAPIEKIIHKEKISRFINLAKTSHNFVIYDVPFKTAVGFGKDFTFMADNVVVTVDCSNWGITKTMLNMCNVEDDDMQETLFNRGQILFNRYRNVNKVMGRKVKTALDISKVMDFKVRDLLGEDPGYYFQSMHICGLIHEDNAFEAGWFERTQYSDTSKGSKVFLELLNNIVLKR